MLEIESSATKLFPNLIESIWTLQNKGKEVELITPPDQYINLIFVLNNSTYERDGFLIDTHQIEGISLKNTVLKYPSGTELIGVRFYAYGLYPFVQIQGKELVNNSIHLLLDIEDTKCITKYALGSSQLLIQEVYGLLNGLFSKQSYDTLNFLMDFYKRFRWQEETVSIEEYCKQTDTNYTSLNRNFSRITGIPPKKFERLIKFRKSLCSLMDSNEKLTSIATASGYFDQAHFIREFKTFLNNTPSEYLAMIKQADKESQIINYNFRLF
ncbi:AraC family transcriptional regulator [Sinomicrobium kalidii]|uniref:helix-turn-helix domain-containing protein n=1 Tax=Sinomicrobium kalidii TaxID=2900738 RepID=UPI001E45684C|nr:AraC family transcriptional regulator [Sinomicrobium kalidii]UGU17425.1 AraC family transcriptional regulator [Sinomicrobium kalidii]